MVRRLEGGEEALRTHRENLRSAVKGFKDAIDNRTAPAPTAQKTDARTALWEFAQIRKEAEEETAALAGYFVEGMKLPSDYELRFGRVCLAQYLLDKLGQMAAKSVESRKSASVSLFSCARDAVKNILDELYFFKSKDQIYSDYMQAEVAFVSCAEALGVGLLQIEQAQSEYAGRLVARINQINGIQ
jgi:hypothetical protein